MMTVNSKNSQAFLFGVRLDDTGSRDVLVERLLGFLEGAKAHVIATPNPEILLLAREHSAYRDVLSASDLNIPDGIGIKVVRYLQGRKRPFRMAGIDIGELLLDMAHAKRLPVLFLGGQDGAATSAADRITKARTNLKIFAAADDAEFNESGDVADAEEAKRIKAAILQTKPVIVLVGLGAPKQEQWIHANRDRFPSVRVFIGVGGAFDVWSGRLRRAPKVMRALGLEWLWRLLLEPTRFPRIFRAVFVFPL